VIDAGNGVAGEIAPILLRTLGCEVIELFCNIDGGFPNHHPDPSKPKNLVDLIAAPFLIICAGKLRLHFTL
jgi:phosphomannomutase/phosphoglucomutase